jgi:Protein required for attachment to host cells
MNEHYVIVADHGHLRIFEQRQLPEQTSPTLQEIDTLDFPHGVKSYVHGDTDMAGRFQGSQQQGRGPGAPTARMGMSIDERLPMAEEEERRRTEDIVKRIEAFIGNHPDITWDFAAGPSMKNAVIEHLSPQARAGLQRAIAKDLVHQPVTELLSHFSGEK